MNLKTLQSKLDSQDDAHSAIGASGCPRWFLCSGSVALIASLPKKGANSFFAVEGTVAHCLAEIFLINRGSAQISTAFRSLLGEKVKCRGFEIEITEEMLDAVFFYVTTILADYKKYFVDDFQGVYPSFNIEKPFHLKGIDEEAFGTNDCSMSSPYGKLFVYDFKYGKGVKVYAEENLQLLYYALGASENQDFSEIDLVIIQPRVEQPIERWNITPERLEEFEKELIQKVKEIRSGNTKLVPGDKQCKFCPAIAHCPEQRKLVMKTAQHDFKDIVSKKIRLSEAVTITPENITDTLAVIPIIESWFKAVKAEALAMAEKGIRIPGMKLVDTYGNREYKSQADVEATFKAYGKDIYTEPKLKSPAALEKIVGKKALELYTVKPYTGVKLVPETDKRQEAKAAIETDFEKLD